jgi:hypothetical protein
LEPTAEELARAQRKDALAQRIFAVLAAAQDGEGDGAVDANESIDALAFVIALMVEYSPNTLTPYDIQRTAEQVATNIHRMAHQARAMTDQTGRHPIEMFGASSPVFISDR